MCPLSEMMSSLWEAMMTRRRRLPREGCAWEDYCGYPDPGFQVGPGVTVVTRVDNVYVYIFHCYIHVLLIKPSSMIYYMLY